MKLIDVRDLPDTAHGARDPLSWGVFMLILIEGMGFALLAVAWLYVRGNYDMWTPQAIGKEAMLAECVCVGALVLSGAIELYGVFVARSPGKKLRRMQIATVLATLLGVVAIAARIYEIPRLGFRWDQNAHGSVFWAILFLHSVHTLAGTYENGVFSALLLFGPVEKKHPTDLENNGFYWLFVVGSWLLLFPLLYLERFFFAK
jgi:cytochrome c oxidase subunit III